MTASNFDRCLARVLSHEGGYVDHPDDPGGATNMGITIATLSDWRGRPVSKAEVKALTRAKAAAIYRANYWNACSCDDLPAGIDACVFDAAVNSGPGRAVRWLQAALGIKQDGVVGPVTLAAARAADAREVIDAMCDLRLSFLRSLGTWDVFGAGWRRRVRQVRKNNIAVAGAASQSTTSRPRSSGSTRRKNPMRFIIDRLAERSTWQGLVALLGAFGIAMRPELIEAFITVGLAAAGLINLLVPDKASK